MSIELEPKSPQIEFELKSQTIGMEHIKAEFEHVLREKFALEFSYANVGDKFVITKRYCKHFHSPVSRIGVVLTVREIGSNFISFSQGNNPKRNSKRVLYVSLENLHLLDKVQS